MFKNNLVNKKKMKIKLNHRLNHDLKVSKPNLLVVEYIGSVRIQLVHCGSLV